MVKTSMLYLHSTNMNMCTKDVNFNNLIDIMEREIHKNDSCSVIGLLLGYSLLKI